MRYMIGILLLASPAVAGEPVYSWQSRADDPDRVYLYLDGKQIGGWDYRLKHYRSFDGTNWGTPTDTPPARRRRIAWWSFRDQPAPMLLQSPVLPPPPIRGPLRRKAVGVMDQAIMDTTVRIINEIPGAIVDSNEEGQLPAQIPVLRHRPRTAARSRNGSAESNSTGANSSTPIDLPRQ